MLQIIDFEPTILFIGAIEPCYQTVLGYVTHRVSIVDLLSLHVC